MKLSPLTVAAALLLSAVASGVAGVYLLAGSGWALIAASIPMLAVGAVLLRGILREMPRGRN